MRRTTNNRIIAPIAESMISPRQTDAKPETQLRKQPACDERTGDADQNIADDAKAGASNDLSGKPARNQADEQDDKKAFT